MKVVRLPRISEEAVALIVIAAVIIAAACAGLMYAFDHTRASVRNNPVVTRAE